MLLTIENYYGPRVERILSDLATHDLNLEAAETVAKNPHLWPFYFHPPAGQVFMVPAKAPDHPAVEVYVNHSVWRTACPFCPSGQHASTLDHWFFCAACLNSETGCKSIPVGWPEGADEIERILLARAWVPQRNWYPHETIDQLGAENRGLGVAA